MPVFNTIEHDGRVERCANALAEDHDVTVACINSGSDNLDKPCEMWSCEQIQLPANSGFFAHLVFWLRLVLLALRLRPTVIHAHDYYMAFPGYLCSRLTWASFVYDAHELIIVEDWKAVTTRRKIWYLLESSVIHRATLVICANQQRADLMTEHYGLSSLPTVVTNASPPPESDISELPEDIATNHPSFWSDDCVKLVYAGNLDLSRKLWQFVEAIDELESDYQLLAIGTGPHHEEMERRVRERGLNDQVRFTGRVPRSAILPILEACDVGIVTYSTSELNTIHCAPNKIHEYAHAGLPVLGNDNPGLEQIIERYKIGEVINNRRPVNAIESVVTNLQAYRSNIEDFLAAEDWESEAETLRSAYQRTVKG